MNLICMFLMEKEEKTYSKKLGAFSSVKEELEKIMEKQKRTQTQKS